MSKLKMKDIVDLPFPEIELEFFNYGEALELIKRGKKVSCKRWGLEGKVYVEILRTEFNNGYPLFSQTYAFKTLILTDTTRDTKVVFTPSVENQLDDEWYEVII